MHLIFLPDVSDTELSVSGNRAKWSVSIDPEPTIDSSTEI